MNKPAIIDAISAKLGGSKKTAEEVVDAVFNTITEGLISDKEVTISGFGTFFIKERTARMGINPRTGERIEISATVTPKFRAGKVLKERVK